MFRELDKDNLGEIISTGKTVVVQYSAGWCGNCRVMKPKFKRFASEMEDADFYGIDAEKFTESRKLAKVDNLPTFAVFKNGVLIDQTQTNKTEVLKQFIDEATSN